MVTKLAENPGFVTNGGGIRRETDCLLEGSGFELPVRGSGDSGESVEQVFDAYRAITVSPTNQPLTFDSDDAKGTESLPTLRWRD